MSDRLIANCIVTLLIALPLATISIALSYGRWEYSIAFLAGSAIGIWLYWLTNSEDEDAD